MFCIWGRSNPPHFLDLKSPCQSSTHFSPYSGTQLNYNRRGTSALSLSLSGTSQGFPCTFNFGTEPMDMTKVPLITLVIFQLFGYIHHAGPLLACLGCFSIQHDSQFAIAIAIANSFLYAHAWSLHTLNTLNYMKVLKKQKLFGIYMI